MSKDIEFIEASHEYIVDGLLTPSVTQIIREYLDEGYGNVPQRILNAKAEYGNRVHDWIERFLTTGDTAEDGLSPVARLSIPSLIDCLSSLEMSSKTPLCEIPICYSGLYAGKFDALLAGNNESVLIDVKTTAKYNKEYLEMQLGFYKLGIEETLGITNINKFYCLWAPKKENAQLIEVEPISKNEVVNMAKDYKKRHTEVIPAWLANL